MQKSNFLVLLLILLSAVPAMAQQRSGASGVEIRGTIIEKSNREPVEQATVRLLTVKDSTFIIGAASERNGSFSLRNVRPGNYLMHISYVGFESIYQLLQVSGRTNPVNIGRVEMVDAAILLGEAVVVGKAAEVQVRNDTIEYNADSYKVQEGAVLEELVKRMPGAEVGSDGKITVNGKEIKKILVDGKEFFSDDPKVASKNLPAAMIDKVQVVDRKSDMTMMTGFDDGDEETVINLVVKPGMKEGWFGNAMAGYGSKERYEGNAIVNRFWGNNQVTLMGGLNNTNNMGFTDFASSMMQGGGGGRMMFGGGGGNGVTSSGNLGLNISKEFSEKLTVTGNIRYNGTDNTAITNSSSQTFLRDDTTRFTDRVSSGNRVNDNIRANIRMEWRPDTLTTIIFRPNLSFSGSHISQDETSATKLGLGRNPNAAHGKLSDVESRSSSDGSGFNFEGELDISRKLNSRGRVLSLSLEGESSSTKEDGKNYSNSLYFDGTPDYLIDQIYNYKNSGYNYRLYLSWVEPLGNNNFLQLSYRYSQRNQSSDRPIYMADGDGNYTIRDTSYIEKYNYDFTSQRASLSFKAVRPKYNLTLGANLDPASSKGEIYKQGVVAEEISRSVLNFSPMLQFNYLFSRQSNLRVDYNGRASEPSMTQLQQVRDVTDPNNIVIGNSQLKPSYNNNLNIMFRKFIPEQQTAFMLMAGGNYTTNAIVNDISNLPGGVKHTTYANMDGNYNANLRFMMNTPLKYKERFSKFSVSSMTMGMYSNSNSLMDKVTSNTKSLMLSERAGIDYRSNYFDIGVNGNLSYNSYRYSTRPGDNLNTFRYGVGGTTSLYLYNIAPVLPLVIESDITYSTTSGYSDTYTQKETMWNASIASKPIPMLKGTGTFRMKVYDILQQRANISNSSTDAMYSESRTNTLTSYFMVHFIYRFSIFKGGANMRDAFGGNRRFEGGGPPGGAPPGGGRQGGGFRGPGG
ncbi:MAG: outer membrane beta-barrel protein [Tannerellaceae bacterium]|jgi:hypothetical protein|nr:outer membrane beta-barrel protein [Tannerellaceae bacterium]